MPSFLLVLSPWNDPIPLTRAWCLWEIFCAIDENVVLHVSLPKTERARFVKSLSRRFRVVMDTLARVQAENAEAKHVHDKEMIFAAIRRSVGGFAGINDRVKGHLREWLLATAKKAVLDMEATQSEVMTGRIR
jgi:hypothetical protein